MIAFPKHTFVLALGCLTACAYGNSLCTKADQNATYPKNIGYVLFPTYQPLDVFGPLEILTVLSWNRTLNLHLIAEDLNPVSTAFRSPLVNKFNSSFSWNILPTHTFETAKDLDLDVLFVPGGLGTRAASINTTVDYVRDTYPSLDYILSVCTGARILALAGVLDGRNATTNKLAWDQTTALGPRTNWLGSARWVEDGNVWTTSGVAAGMDGTLGWIEHVWSSDVASSVANFIEYDWHRNASWDPFGELHGTKDVPPRL